MHNSELSVPLSRHRLINVQSCNRYLVGKHLVFLTIKEDGLVMVKQIPLLERLYQFARAVMTKSRSLHGLCNRDVSPHSAGG